MSLAVETARGSNITASAATRACAQLTKALGPAVVHSSVTNDTTYDASAHGAWSVFNQQDGENRFTTLICHDLVVLSIALDPTCIVFPTSAQHVVSAMRTFRSTDASYSIRGGTRHFPMKHPKNHRRLTLRRLFYVQAATVRCLGGTRTYKCLNSFDAWDIHSKTFHSA